MKFVLVILLNFQKEEFVEFIIKMICEIYEE